jgi:spore photoproduct lyase
MSDLRFEPDLRPRRLFIQRKVEQHPYAREIAGNLPGLTPEIVEDEREIFRILDRKESPESAGKKSLYLAHNSTRFFKICPGLGPELACCNLWILNTGPGCNLDCTYCFLQTYLPYSLVTHFVNQEDLTAELDRLLEEHPGRFLRICTGELTDSLSLDPYTRLARRLAIECIARQRVSLELKTKTVCIGDLEGLDSRGRVILSWSVNAQSGSQREELRAASLDHRFEAAAQAERWGYRVGFHFDPIVHFPGWEREYRETIDRIFDTVRPETIAWISLGALRFDPRLKSLVQRRFPSSRFVYGEFIPGPDGKMRYPESLRVEIFSKMKRWIAKRSSHVPVYLCMESYSVWQKAFGRAPACKEEVGQMLDESIMHASCEDKRTFPSR